MKQKLLLSLAFTAGILTSAVAKTFCLTNSYGEQTTLTVVSHVGTVFNLTGSINYGIYAGGTIWPVSGTYDQATKKLQYTATNPNPDGCFQWATTVNFAYSKSGSGSFSNDCGVAGTLTASSVKGSCGFNPVKLKEGEYGGTGSHKMLRSQLALPPGIDLDKILSFNSISVSPNPVQKYAQVLVNVASSTKITVAIYDQNGTLVRTVVNSILSEGNHNYSWNLQMQTGRTVKAGYYTVKLISEDGEQSVKIVVTE